jgi:hypothetical protein
MRFRHVNSYAAPPAEVHAMLVTPEFREEVCVQQHALSHSVEISPDGETTTVLITQSQAMDGAPAAARKLVGSSVQIVQREVWRGGDTGTGADFAMEIPGKPGHLKGGVTLVDNGDGTCDEVFTGEVKVNVPLVGGKLEGFIADLLTRALRREGQVGVTWLEEHRG